MLSGIIVVFFSFCGQKEIKWFLEVPLATPQVSSILIS